MLYITVPTYLLLACIGLCVALAFVYHRRVKIALDYKDFFDYIIVCVIMALIVSRFIFVIGIIPSMEKVTFNELWHYLLNGGIVFCGGLIGVLLGVVLVSKKKKIDAKEMLDTIAPAFPLFHAFARFGCLLAGCCYGVEWSWGVILADEPDVIRFPVQFMESLCNILIFIVLLILERRRKSSKNNLLLYLCSYALCRFVLEFYRGDVVRGIWFGGLSTSQFISIFILLGCGIYFVYMTIQSKKNVEEYEMQQNTW